ncbi:MAG: AEC family transporter [Clostridiaceae bacterium]
MNIFLNILGNNIVPIFLLMGIGYIINRKFDVNIFTLSKLIFYVFVPGYVFYNLYVTDLSFDMIWIILFSIVYMAANYFLAILISKIRKYDMGRTNAFKNCIMFNNSGNIGISLIILVFSNAPYVIGGQTPYLEQAVTAQVIILVFMNITMNTLGFFNAGRATMDMKDSLRQIFTMPSIYAVALALLLKYLQTDVTGTFLWPALLTIKGGLVPMALLTLGVQLSKTKFNWGDADVNLAVFTRLVIGPILAVVFIKIFGFYGVVAQTILISYAVPTAANTALIAVECDNERDYATQEVMVSTIFSTVTLTTVIYFAFVLFPVI